jgi:hypothetical protein
MELLDGLLTERERRAISRNRCFLDSYFHYVGFTAVASWGQRRR